MKQYHYILLIVFLLIGCAKDALDNNTDRKNPSDITAESLFSGATLRLTRNIANPSVNVNVFRFWAQQWTMTTYHDEVQYNFVTRNIHRTFWNNIHVQVLRPLTDAQALNASNEQLSEAQRANQAAQLEILSVYAWEILVNTWGDIPYFEALQDNDTPAYDDAQDIYRDLQLRLANALESIDPSAAGFSQADLLYFGNIAAWERFGHSLRLRLAITLADVDGTASEAIIRSSASRAFQSNADNAIFKFTNTTPNNNPISDNLNPLLTARQDYVAANTLVDQLKGLADPRLTSYFTAVNGEYLGGQIGAPNNYAELSLVHPNIIALDFEHPLLDYAEVSFILAEAAERWNFGDAGSYYDQAIRASLQYWGHGDAAAQEYIQQPAVAYSNGSVSWREKIGIQKWIALYNRGIEAWTEWRRLDFPALQPAIGAVNPGTIPLRFTYPADEYNLNRIQLEEALDRVGEDLVNRRLFWDIY